MLAFVEAEGDYEACKGHPGTWYDIRVIPGDANGSSNGRLEIYMLVEEGRIMQRSLAWSSDCRLSLLHLDEDSRERKEAESINTMFSAGNVFEGHYTPAPTGKLVGRAGAGSRHNEEVYSLTITRERSYIGWTHGDDGRPSAEEHGESETETYVPKSHLHGLLPEAARARSRP